MDYLEGIQKNFDEAAKVLKFNCEDNGHSDSCYKLGAYYVTGKGKMQVFTGLTGMEGSVVGRGRAGVQQRAGRAASPFK